MRGGDRVLGVARESGSSGRLPEARCQNCLGFRFHSVLSFSSFVVLFIARVSNLKATRWYSTENSEERCKSASAVEVAEWSPESEMGSFRTDPLPLCLYLRRYPRCSLANHAGLKFTLLCLDSFCPRAAGRFSE